MASHHVEEVKPKPFVVTQTMKTIYTVAIFLGLILLAGAFVRDQERAWASYLVGFFSVTSIVVASVFFLAVNHMARAGWSVNIRRIPESMTAFAPVILVGSLALFGSLSVLYPWANPELMATDPLLQAKKAYLNIPFFLVRMLIFGVGMILFARVLVQNSLKQDSDGDERWTHRQIPFSIGYLFFFALSFSFFTVDTLMALLPHWYSTIFGIYAFSGGMQAALAFMILIAIEIVKRGYVGHALTIDHVHDLAKYLKGFTIFWAYIAFSQYLLIWYTNIPEETEFYYIRADGAWAVLSLALIVFRFAVPFLALLPRWAKRTTAHLQAVCALVLVMHVVDVFWLVNPNIHHHEFVFGPFELGGILFFGGLFLMTTFGFLAKNSLLPVKDPRRHESYGHHVTY